MIGLNSLSKKVDKLDADLRSLAAKRDQPFVSPAVLKEALDKIESKISDAENNLQELKEAKDDTAEDTALIDTKIEALRKNLMQVISNVSSNTSGGGNANRNIQVGGVNVLRPFTDINLIAGANTTIASVANQTTKYTDITITATGGGGSGITIGTTTITSGTDTRILYDNAGVVGEYTLTGTGTVAVMQTSPSLITPALGVATATSLAIGGATIGSNGLAITGHVLIEGVTSTGATGTGKFVFDGTPTLVTPVLGVATATSLAIGGATIGSNGLAVTGHLLLEGVTSTGATGTGKLVFDTAPTLSNPVVGTQATTDNSTKAASTAYVTTGIANAIAGVNPAVAVQYATTAAGDTSGLTYANAASGIGATLTGANNTAVAVDGHTFVIGDVGIARLLVKNDTQSPSGAFNGVYLFTALQTVGTGAIFTRALDYDTPSDINNTGAIPVVSGTVNALTSWLLTSNVTTVGTDPLTYSKFSINPTTQLTTALTSAHILVGNSSNIATDVAMSGDISITNAGATTVAKIAGTTVTATTGSTNVVFSNSPTLVTPTLGVATATSINGLTITTTTGTLTMTNGKTLTVSDSTTLATNAITLGGGEVITFSASNALSLLTSGSTSMTFPAVTDTVAVLGTAQSFTAVNTNSTDYRLTPQTVTVSSNAGTCDINHGIQNFTNSSASAMTITLTTTSAVDGQKKIVRIFDASAASKGITWVGTENSLVTAPANSNGSTSIPTTVGFIYNSGTSKWTCVAAC